MQCNILIICISYGIMSSLANDEHSIDETDENDLSERKLLMAEEPLRDYLGYYGEFISEKDADWCPKICESATTIYESPNLRSYCTCEDKKNTVKHDCPAHEIFNRTLGVCSKLPGGGTASCVLKNHNCPKNHRGLIAHPDRNLFQDYILCMDNLVIVAICDDMYYYDSDDKICRKMNIEDTYLSASDCPIIPGIECSEPGIIPMNDGQVFESESLRCANCFYLCSVRDVDTFELKISCENITIHDDTENIRIGEPYSQIIENENSHHHGGFSNEHGHTSIKSGSSSSNIDGTVPKHKTRGESSVREITETKHTSNDNEENSPIKHIGRSSKNYETTNPVTENGNAHNHGDFPKNEHGHTSINSGSSSSNFEGTTPKHTTRGESSAGEITETKHTSNDNEENSPIKHIDGSSKNYETTNPVTENGNAHNHGDFPKNEHGHTSINSGSSSSNFEGTTPKHTTRGESSAGEITETKHTSNDNEENSPIKHIDGSSKNYETTNPVTENGNAHNHGDFPKNEHGHTSINSGSSSSNFEGTTPKHTTRGESSAGEITETKHTSNDNEENSPIEHIGGSSKNYETTNPVTENGNAHNHGDFPKNEHGHTSINSGSSSSNFEGTTPKHTTRDESSAGEITETTHTSNENKNKPKITHTGGISKNYNTTNSVTENRNNLNHGGYPKNEDEHTSINSGSSSSNFEGTTPKHTTRAESSAREITKITHTLNNKENSPISHIEGTSKNYKTTNPVTENQNTHNHGGFPNEHRHTSINSNNSSSSNFDTEGTTPKHKTRDESSPGEITKPTHTSNEDKENSPITHLGKTSKNYEITGNSPNTINRGTTGVISTMEDGTNSIPGSNLQEFNDEALSILEKIKLEHELEELAGKNGGSGKNTTKHITKGDLSTLESEGTTQKNTSANRGSISSINGSYGTTPKQSTMRSSTMGITRTTQDYSTINSATNSDKGTDKYNIFNSKSGPHTSEKEKIPLNSTLSNSISAGGERGKTTPEHKFIASSTTIRSDRITEKQFTIDSTSSSPLMIEMIPKPTTESSSRKRIDIESGIVSTIATPKHTTVTTMKHTPNPSGSKSTGMKGITYEHNSTNRESNPSTFLNTVNEGTIKKHVTSGYSNSKIINNVKTAPEHSILSSSVIDRGADTTERYTTKNSGTYKSGIEGTTPKHENVSILRTTGSETTTKYNIYKSSDGSSITENKGTTPKNESVKKSTTGKKETPQKDTTIDGDFKQSTITKNSTPRTGITPKPTKKLNTTGEHSTIKSTNTIENGKTTPTMGQSSTIRPIQKNHISMNSGNISSNTDSKGSIPKQEVSRVIGGSGSSKIINNEETSTTGYRKTDTGYSTIDDVRDSSTARSEESVPEHNISRINSAGTNGHSKIMNEKGTTPKYSTSNGSITQKNRTTINTESGSLINEGKGSNGNKESTGSLLKHSTEKSSTKTKDKQKSINSYSSPISDSLLTDRDLGTTGSFNTRKEEKKSSTKTIDNQNSTNSDSSSINDSLLTSRDLVTTGSLNTGKINEHTINGSSDSSNSETARTTPKHIVSITNAISSKDGDKINSERNETKYSTSSSSSITRSEGTAEKYTTVSGPTTSNREKNTGEFTEIKSGGSSSINGGRKPTDKFTIESMKITPKRTTQRSTRIGETISEYIANKVFTGEVANNKIGSSSSSTGSKGDAQENSSTSLELSSSDRPCPSEGFFRYNQSCSMHYECYYSERHKKIVASRLYECPNCLQFNAKVSRCDLPESVPECSIHDPTYQYVQGYRITKPVKICTGPGIFADPVDSKKFYECADIFDENINYLTVSSCPHGTHFNPHTKQCEQEYVRQKNYNLLGGCKTKKYAFHKSSCQTFFYCVDETKSVEMKCLDGYMFNGQFCQLKVQTVYCNWEPLKKNLFKHYNKY